MLEQIEQIIKKMKLQLQEPATGAKSTQLSKAGNVDSQPPKRLAKACQATKHRPSLQSALSTTKYKILSNPHPTHTQNGHHGPHQHAFVARDYAAQDLDPEAPSHQPTHLAGGVPPSGSPGRGTTGSTPSLRLCCSTWPRRSSVPCPRS